MAQENSFVCGVILFGSLARGESVERSDIDLLVLWRGLHMDRRERYVYIYRVASQYFSPSRGLTVLDMEYDKFLGFKKITSLALNMIWDGIVLYDKYGKLKGYLERLREGIKNKGLTRIKIGRYYYWKLPKPKAKVILEV